MNAESSDVVGALVSGELLRAAAVFGGRPVLEALSGDDPSDARSLGRVWAAALALAAGWELDKREGQGLVVHRSGARALLLPVAVPTPIHPPAVQAIQGVLQPILKGRSWALVLRRPIAPGTALDRIAEPTRQWVARYDQQQWDADYAIYEDRDISVELRLLPFAPTADGAARIRLPRPPSDDLLDQVQPLLGGALEGSVPELPIVLVPVGQERWRLGRRTRIERLYGKVIEMRGAGPGQGLVSVRRTDTAWFGAAGWDRVAAIWWLGADPQHPLCPRGMADENPWCAGAAPVFVGERMAVTAVGSLDHRSPPASLRRVRPAVGVRP